METDGAPMEEGQDIPFLKQHVKSAVPPRSHNKIKSFATTHLLLTIVVPSGGLSTSFTLTAACSDSESDTKDCTLPHTTT